MDFGTLRNMDTNNRLALILYNFRIKISCRLEQNRIAHDLDNVLDHIDGSLLWYTLYSSVIKNAQIDIAAKTVQEGAYGFINIVFDATTRTFELHSNRFTDSKDIFQFRQFHSHL